MLIRVSIVLTACCLASGVTAPTTAVAQKRSAPKRSTPKPSKPKEQAPITLVFDGATVIDVEGGRTLPDQRVVVVGDRIQGIGSAKNVLPPGGAKIINAKGKYLIPGLWDMNIQPGRYADYFYPMLVANGVTGIQDVGSEVPLDTLQLWRNEVLAGTRTGPPRQMLSGQAIGVVDPKCVRSAMSHSPATCIIDTTDAVRYVDSLHALKADVINMLALKSDIVWAISREAQRLRIVYGGDAPGRAPNDTADPRFLEPMEFANGGAKFVHHQVGDVACQSAKWDSASYVSRVDLCQQESDIDRMNNAWFIAAFAGTDRLRGPAANAVFAKFSKQVEAFWNGTALQGNWLHDSTAAPQPSRAPGSGTFGAMTMAEETKLPMITGTGSAASVMRTVPPGLSIHAELAMMVAEGASPMRALQSATINAAKVQWMTESLGSIYPGKMADLVLLDANPLDDITNTTTIRAVVANGHYYDRAALDHLLSEAQAKAKQETTPLGTGR